MTQNIVWNFAFVVAWVTIIALLLLSTGGGGTYFQIALAASVVGYGLGCAFTHRQCEALYSRRGDMIRQVWQRQVVAPAKRAARGADQTRETRK